MEHTDFSKWVYLEAKYAIVNGEKKDIRNVNVIPPINRGGTKYFDIEFKDGTNSNQPGIIVDMEELFNRFLNH